MISKNTIKLIHSLSQKKYREKEELFLVEGDKNVLDVLRSPIGVPQLFATQAFLFANTKEAANAVEVNEVGFTDIKKASLQKSPQNSIALCKLPAQGKIPGRIEGKLSLYLDGIQDPGNMGTIIRIGDWFGIEYIFCSHDTVDIYNPKVVQSSMGSICRTNVIYTGIENILGPAKISHAQITGAFLEGENIFHGTHAQKTVLVVGNEGNGIRKGTASNIEKKIMIPDFSDKRHKAESLNVAVATGIICAELSRRFCYSK